MTPGDTLLRRVWALRWPAAVVTAVVGSAFAPQPALWDAATREAVPFERTTGLAYLAGAPLFGLWDSLSVLAGSQHLAVVTTLAVWYLLRRLLARRRSKGGARHRVQAIAMETARAAAALLLLVAFYVGGALAPRPMTGIDLGDPQLLAVDFHSHTHRSHDGRRVLGAFTAARNREWHESAGFDAAYVTDHYTWDGVDDASPANPARAGDRTVLLSGAELRLRNHHTNVLGSRSRYAFALDDSEHHLDEDSLAAAYGRNGRPPTMLHTIPGPIDRIVAFGPQQPAGVVGVELSDGAPRGLEQARAEREEILALADSLDLAVVAGANVHGWGRTAAAWSVMRMPGWRDMTPAGLGAAIEAALHRDRRRAASVVERRMPYHDGEPLRIAATLPWLLWEHFRMLAPAERVSWLAWVAAWVAAARAWRKRRASVESAGA